MAELGGGKARILTQVCLRILALSTELVLR